LAGAWRNPRRLEQQAERHAGPLPDRASAFEPIMPRDLGARWQLPDLRDRERQRMGGGPPIVSRQSACTNVQDRVKMNS